MLHQNKFKLAIASTLVFSILSFASAEIIPAPSTFDKRVQFVDYNPQNVTVVKVKVGTATLIQLNDEEYIGEAQAGFAIGDPLAWDVVVKQNNIFIRPKAENFATNVVFTTNKRTYALNLSSASGNEEPTYYLKYKYPQEEQEKRAKAWAEAQAKKKAEQERKRYENQPKSPPCSNGNVNLDYYVKGSEEITPLAVWDDGEFTCMKWDNSKSLPVPYRVLNDGKNTEVLTNTHMDGNILVIHEVSPRFALRHGDLVAEVKTESYIPKNNRSRTTMKDVVLVPISD